MDKNSRRNTKQRRVILGELLKTKAHPDASALFKIVRRRIPDISIGTVYRNLNLLKGDGRIIELACGRHSSHYDADLKSHYHFFCLDCGNILDLDEPLLRSLDNEVSKRSGMTVKYHRVDFYGYCGNCKNNRS
jgi:Fur family transcriptional regulator, peroxide stress response regulator